MIQQINLYRFLPQKRKMRLTFEVMKLCWGVFFLLLLLNFAYLIWQKHKSTLRLESLHAEWVIQQKRLAALGAKYGAVSPTDLANMIAQLQKNFQLNSKMLAQLFNQLPLSNYLQGFAQAVVPGVWLTQFSVSIEGPRIDLQGKALQALQGQQFLDALQAQPIFANITFVLKDLAQAEDVPVTEKPHVSFHITTKGSENG